MGLRNAFENLNEEQTQLDTKDLLRQILKELKILNARFEEAFDTQLTEGDFNDED